MGEYCTQNQTQYLPQQATVWISSFFPCIMHQGLCFNSHFSTNWGKPSAWRSALGEGTALWPGEEAGGLTTSSRGPLAISSPAHYLPGQRTDRWMAHSHGPELEFQHQEQGKTHGAGPETFQQDQQHQLTSGLWIHRIPKHNWGLVLSPSKERGVCWEMF